MLAFGSLLFALGVEEINSHNYVGNLTQCHTVTCYCITGSIRNAGGLLLNSQTPVQDHCNDSSHISAISINSVIGTVPAGA